MPTLILLCGRPFSGKSHLAGRLAADRGAAGISFDAINLSEGCTAGMDCPSRSGRRRWRSLVARSSLVVVDDTLCFRWMRDTFRDIAQRAGARPLLLYLDPPQAVLQARVAENQCSGARRGIAPAVLAEHLATFEAPEKDEAAVVRGVRPDVVVPGAGHLVNLTHPEAVNVFLRRAIETWLD